MTLSTPRAADAPTLDVAERRLRDRIDTLTDLNTELVAAIRQDAGHRAVDHLRDRLETGLRDLHRDLAALLPVLDDRDVKGFLTSHGGLWAGWGRAEQYLASRATAA